MVQHTRLKLLYQFTDSVICKAKNCFALSETSL
jgi:hypothetical protein